MTNENQGGDWDRAVNLGCPTEEPTLREMVAHYYRSHSMPDPLTWTDRYFAALSPREQPEPVAWRWEQWSSLSGVWADRLTFDRPADHKNVRNVVALALYAQPSEQTGAWTADDLRVACATVADALVCEGPEHRLIHERDKYSLRRIATDSKLPDAILAALSTTGGAG